MQLVQYVVAVSELAEIGRDDLPVKQDAANQSGHLDRLSKDPSSEVPPSLRCDVQRNPLMVRPCQPNYLFCLLQDRFPSPTAEKSRPANIP